MTRVLSRVSFKTIIVSICLFWSAQSALATTVVRALDEDMIVGARAIITGKVLQIESAIDEQQDRIYTYITVRVTEVIKGQITERKIILKEFGGVVGDRVSVVFGSPQFKRGEKVLLYLGTHNDGSLRTYQLFLGKFSIVRDDATGNRFAERDAPGENVTVLTMQGQAQGDSTDRMELSSYTDMVRTKLASNLERSQAFENTYYKNVPVLASPPGFVSSKKQVHSEYTFLGNVRWFQPDSGQVVPYTICPNPAQGAPQVVPDPNDIAAAANAWTGVPGSSLALSYSGNLDNCYTQMGTTGINIVSNNCDGYNQPSSGCANILAIGGWSAGGYQTRVIGGITFGQITQGFVSFNPWASCYFSDHCNFREVATHELGHALGLAHSADPTATMYAYAHFDGRCASIKQDEINGIKFLYPGSGGGPGPLAVVTSSLSGGTTGTPYSQPLTGSGGTLPYAWSLVAGLGTLPTGLSLSAAGTISGTPNTAGTYNFTVRVTDAASATAQKALSIVVVPAGAGPLNSQFVSQTVPTSLQPGQAFTVNMKFLNTGTQTWSGTAYYFASQNPPLNQTWGGNGVPLLGFTAAPGEQLDVNFTATAPTTPGTYNFQWQMYQDGGAGFFGQVSTNVAIQVGVSASNAARFISQSVPASISAGQSFNVSVTVQNSGTTTWTAAGFYSLGAAFDTTPWNIGNRVALPSSVAPGAQVTFTFTVQAPATPGTYNFQWRMVQDGVEWFGQGTTNIAVVVSGSMPNAAQFISQSVPASISAGQSFNVSVTMQNSGTTTWTAAGFYSLGAAFDTSPWGISNRVGLPASVAPGAQVTFSFTVTAPGTAATYNSQWRMVQDGVEWFGQATTNVAVTVSGSMPNSAQFISQSVPSSMTAGQSYNVSVTMKNTGTNTWTAASSYRLGAAVDTAPWGIANRVNLPTSVAPGGQVTFSFTVTAPSTPGVYSFWWRMVQDDVEWFGQATTNLAINVNGGGTNNAQFISQSVPAFMTAGQAYNVSVTMKNTGTTTWATAGFYSLGAAFDTTPWSISNRVNLPASVAPGAQVTFNFTVHAPATAGSYGFQWRMVQDGVEWFGQGTTNVPVIVSP